jgi:hypothetical protein
MRIKRIQSIAALALIVSCVAVAPAGAGVVSNTGAFATDDEQRSFLFTVVIPGVVTMQSWGYGGGVNGAGTTIPSGGFATNLTLFDAAAPQNKIAEDTLGGTPPSDCAPRNIDSDTGQCLDAYLSVALTPGSYILVLTQQGNPSAGPTLSDGFLAAGSGDFTGGPFLDPFSNPRTGDFAVDISSDALQTPEPGAAGLVLPAVVLGLFWRRKVSSLGSAAGRR